MNSSNDKLSQKGAAPCPICKTPAAAAAADYAPFCSKRCADVDLHRWMAGSYAIPAAEEDDSAAEGDGES